MCCLEGLTVWCDQVFLGLALAEESYSLFELSNDFAILRAGLVHYKCQVVTLMLMLPVAVTVAVAVTVKLTVAVTRSMTVTLRVTLPLTLMVAVFFLPSNRPFCEFGES